MEDTVSVIRVAIVEDQMMLAQALQTALATQPDLQVVGVAPTLKDGMDLVRREQPDVVLMDHRLPDGEGARAAPQIQDIAAKAAVLIMTADDRPVVVAAALSSGCAGLLLKGSTVDQLAQAIRSVHGGEGVFSQHMLAAVHARRGVAMPTDREMEILLLLDEGLSTKEIAERLVVSLHTVRNHVRHLTAKLGTRTRLEALAVARDEGLVGPARL